MSKLGIVTGLQFEADILKAAANGSDCADALLISASGPGRARAREAAADLVEQGATGLFSMGLAGALDMRLRPGDVICATAVRKATGQRLPCHLDAQKAIAQTLEGDGLIIHSGDLVEALTPAASRGAKRALYRETKALAVDMESWGVAEVAARSSIPFLAMRVIADPADQEIPVAALMGMRNDGSVSALRVLAGAIKSPGVFPELLKLSRQTKEAKNALGRFGKRLFALLGLIGMRF